MSGEPRFPLILDRLQKLVTREFGASASDETALKAALEGLAEVLAGCETGPGADRQSGRAAPSGEPTPGERDESEARWRTLVENAPDYVLTLDPALRITFLNRPAPGASPPVEILGTPVTGIVDEADRDFVVGELRKVCRTGDPTQFEMRGLGPDGGVAWFSIRVAPVIRDGRVTSLVVIGRDITERHAMVQALKASEARYRHLWENLNDAAFIADVESGFIVETNARAERLLGLPRERIVGMHQTELHPPHKVEQYAEQFRRHAEQGGTVYDVEVVRADGTVVPVDISADDIVIDGQHLMLGLFHDISERKAIIRDLEFMQFAVERAGDAVFWMDSELRFRQVNQEACRRLGYSREELLTMSVPDIVPDAAGARKEEEYRELTRHGKLTKRSLHRCKDGTLLPVEVSINRFRFEGEDFFCSIARDISDREAAERALLERDANLQAVTDNANDGIAVRIGNRHVFVNRRFADMLGYPSTDALLAVPVLDLIAPAERAHMADVISRRSGADEPPTQYETLLQRKDGAPLPVEITVAETLWSGEPAHLIVIRDITARKRYEQALREKAEDLQNKSDALEQVNRELQQIIYVIAHDLKAPLRAVSQLAAVLQREMAGTLAGEPLRMLDLIEARVQRMHTLIEALLAYSGAGQRTTRDVVDVTELLVEVVSVLDIPASFEIAFDAMPVIETDRLQLRQVFSGLIGNAIEHHDRADGRVHIGCRPVPGGHEFVVTDDGPGIPAEHHERIFEMFQTLDTRDRHEQAGVGLTLARKLVEGCGGSIGVESAPGNGAVFRFTWPGAVVPSRALEASHL